MNRKSFEKFFEQLDLRTGKMLIWFVVHYSFFLFYSISFHFSHSILASYNSNFRFLLFAHNRFRKLHTLCDLVLDVYFHSITDEHIHATTHIDQMTTNRFARMHVSLLTESNMENIFELNVIGDDVFFRMVTLPLLLLLFDATPAHAITVSILIEGKECSRTLFFAQCYPMHMFMRVSFRPAWKIFRRNFLCLLWQNNKGEFGSTNEM